MTDFIEDFGHHRHSVNGGIHPTAVIGSPPELREWKPGDPVFSPRVHKTARIHAYCTVDAGGHRPTVIGARSWLLKRVHVGHDCQIGEGVEIAPGAVLGGEVILEDDVRVGINASIRPGIVVGKGARIGAGAVVVRNVRPGTIVAGNPARELGSNSADGFGRDGVSMAKIAAA